MVQPTQDSDGGWAANRPVGGQGRTLTIGQKVVRGKMINFIMVSSI